MPVYDNLSIKNVDSPDTKALKTRIAKKIIALKKHLAHHFEESNPSYHHNGKHVRIATWNIREFEKPSYGPRLDESYYYITEIISQFDLVALQEIYRNREALDRLLALLGPNWNYIVTDVNEGVSGNDERMAYMYNTNKVEFKNLAGEINLPAGEKVPYPSSPRYKGERIAGKNSIQLKFSGEKPLVSPDHYETYVYGGKTKLKDEVKIDLPEDTYIRLPKGTQLVLPPKMVIEKNDDGTIKLNQALDQILNSGEMIEIPEKNYSGEFLQIARTPFFVAFQSGWLKLNLCTVHIYYGDENDPAKMRRRNEEIKKITKQLALKAENEIDSDHDSFFVLLGDFNIAGKDHVTMKSLNSNGFKVPDEIMNIPGTNVKKDKLYDQIAIWTDVKGKKYHNTVAALEICSANVFDYFKTVFRIGEQDENGEDETYYDQFLTKPDGEKYKYSEWRTYQMSDHLPMWVEFKVDYGEEFLNEIIQSIV